MKPNPIITQLVALLGGPALFPQLTESQVHELIEERLADFLAEIHAGQRAVLLGDYLAVSRECAVQGAREIAVKLSPAYDHSRSLPVTADAEGVTFFPGSIRGLSAELEDKVRTASERWYRIPPPRGPLSFLTIIRSKKTSNRKASRG